MCSKTNYRCKSVKFTLIELLVVTAIISILMTMLLPALKKAKEQSRRAVCASNLKQIGVAMSMYCNDYEGWYPDARPNGPWQVTGIRPYLQAPAFGESIVQTPLWCPSESRIITADYTEAHNTNGDCRAYSAERWSNYAMLNYGYTVNNHYGQFKCSLIKNHSKHVIIIDSLMAAHTGHTAYGNVKLYGIPYQTHAYDKTIMTTVPFARHSRRTQYVCFDGHTEHMPSCSSDDSECYSKFDPYESNGLPAN